MWFLKSVEDPSVPFINCFGTGDCHDSVHTASCNASLATARIEKPEKKLPGL